jgi:hypothetical protein
LQEAQRGLDRIAKILRGVDPNVNTTSGDEIVEDMPASPGTSEEYNY